MGGFCTYLELVTFDMLSKQKHDIKNNKKQSYKDKIFPEQEERKGKERKEKEKKVK